MVYVETTGADDLIVLNPRWLCGEVLGKLLSDCKHLPSVARLSSTQLTDLFPAIDVADSATLLTALELCSVVSAGTAYQLSCRNSLPVPAEDRRKSDSTPCVGGVALVADAKAQLQYVFPRVQHAIWNCAEVPHLSEWNGGIRVRRVSDSDQDDVATVQISTENSEDLIRVICCGHNPQNLYDLQQTIAAIVLRVIDACCPGVYLQLRALSPRDIRLGDRPLPRAYSSREVATAQLDRREGVRLDEGGDEESLKEVLTYGDEGLFASLCPGVDSHVSEMPMYLRCRLAALLDPPHPQGRDWLLLALGLGLSDSLPRVDSPDVAATSRTVCLLALWSSNRDATVRRLLDVVRRTIQRPDVEDELLRLTPFCRPSAFNPDRSVCPSPEANHISSADCKTSTASNWFGYVIQELDMGGVHPR